MSEIAKMGYRLGLIRNWSESATMIMTSFLDHSLIYRYTEPSMEIFGFHPDLNKWTEIGNSGMFRPEMLRPMGLPEDVRVIACGLSLER